MLKRKNLIENIKIISEALVTAGGKTSPQYQPWRKWGSGESRERKNVSALKEQALRRNL
jgi:hypothetical protein